jgi:ribonuclease P protein component
MPVGRRLGFGPGVRLTGRRDFKRVFSEGRKVACASAVLWHRGGAAARPQARLGVTISAKSGGAVLRNRLKRLAREAFRLNRARLKAGVDLVVFVRPGCLWRGLAQAERDLLGLFKKAGLTAA